jgi:hypothetical protein
MHIQLHARVRDLKIRQPRLRPKFSQDDSKLIYRAPKMLCQQILLFLLRGQGMPDGHDLQLAISAAQKRSEYLRSSLHALSILCNVSLDLEPLSIAQ